MNYAKKYPLFFTTLAIFLLVFIVAFIWNIMLSGDLSAAESEYKAAELRYKSALGQEPTEETLEESAKNLKLVEGKLSDLEASLSSKSSDIIQTLAPDTRGFAFQNRMIALIDTLIADAKSKDISLEKTLFFGYGKYYNSGSTPPPDEAINELWTQFSVLKYIVEKLYAAKGETGAVLHIDVVQREELPVEAVAEVATTAKKTTSKFRTTKKTASQKGSKDTSDTFIIPKSVSARKDGRINSYAYKLSFRSNTDVLRAFLNSLKDFEIMLVVRSVDVVRAKPIEYVEVDTRANGEDEKPLTAEEIAFNEIAENTPIIGSEETLSEFTVIIEYIELSKEEPKSEDEEDEEDDEYDDEDEEDEEE